MTDRPPPAESRLPWPPLLRGKLVRRYRRFLADVVLDSGEAVTAHCPNTGAMISCCEPGRPVFLSRSDNPRRKLPYTWEIIDMGTSLVGVNTAVPNRLVEHAVRHAKIPELGGYGQVRREVPYGDHSRIDLLLSGPGRPDCYVEIKNCTLVTDGIARFPDAVTSRGLKHLHDLVETVHHGNRAAMFYFVQRMDAETFLPADRIDPAYGIALRAAVDAGVEMMVYDVRLDLDGIELCRPLPWSL
ncbi:MAG: DNA/RNA nuclease SfsA [Desulfobacterales bacterium]